MKRIAAVTMVRNDDFFLLNLAALKTAKTLRWNAYAIFLAIAGIKHPQLAVFYRAATGITAVLIVFIIRPQRQFRHAVMDEIARFGMCPTLIFMFTAQRIPLIKEMELIIAKSQAVRVINEAKGHFQMKTVIPTVFHWKTGL